MSGLDSYYAMIAQPVKAVLQPKRVVDQVRSATANAPDSHETPQSQLPPTLEQSLDKTRDQGEKQQQPQKRAANGRETDALLDITDDEANSQSNPSHHIIDIEV